MKSPGMHRFFRYSLLALLVGIIPQPEAQVQDYSNFNTGHKLLIEARDLIYNFDHDDTGIVRRLTQSRTFFESIPEIRERMYWIAEVEYLSGFLHLKQGLKKQAETSFDNCRTILARTMVEHGEFGEGYALMADAYVQLMWSRGITYQLLNAQKLKVLPQKAMELSPQNIRAHHSLAVFHMNAPQAIGGNIEKAITLLSGLSSSDKGELFSTYYLLSTAYTKKHDTGNAIKYLHMALDLYPENRWALEDLEKISMVKQ